MNRRFDLCANRIHGFAEIVGKLHTQPVTGCLTEICAKMEIGFRRNTTLLVDDFVDALMWQLRIFGEPVGSDTHWPKELFPKKLSRVNIDKFIHSS